MKANRVLVLSCLLLALTAAIAVAAEAANANVAGVWTMAITTPRGERTSTLTFVQDGEKLTVTSRNDRGESTGTGTIKGVDIEWSITRQTPRGEMTVTYKGKVDGDTMSGETKMMDNSIPWKASRSK